jgi:hypothetical protein
LSTQLFAKGTKDETEPATQNDEWLLCITDFDSSSLPPGRTNISSVITRELVERLTTISYHARISPEYAYYEERAWAQARSTAAKALSAKIEERSSRLYQGEPEWMYRRNIARIDAEIEKLTAALEEIENNAPLINREPVFNLSARNLDFTFPTAPSAGNERRFCNDQKADAFLAGSIIDFHGRYYFSLKLYTVYTRSYVWEDNILFSHDDLSASLDEIIIRLIVVLSGNQPSTVTINSEPEDTMILINRAFAGRGASTSLEYPPGTITVTATAPNHESLTFETELLPGDLTKITLKLNPIEFVDLEIDSDFHGKVYQGALYVGQSPLTLRLPVNQLEFIEVETENNRRGTVVFQTPDASELSGSISMRTELIPKNGRVDRSRRHYYWAWGATWITGMTAWISYYTYMGMESVLLSGSYTNEFANDAQNMLYIRNGALIAFGVAAVYGIVRMIDYLYVSSRGRTQIVNPGRN